MKEYISASYCQLTLFCTFCFLLFSFLYEANLHIIFCNKLHLWKVVVTLLCFCQKRPTRLFFCSLRKQKATHLDVTIPPPQHHTCLEERFGSSLMPTKDLYLISNIVESTAKSQAEALLD